MISAFSNFMNRVEKEITLNNSKKTIAFIRKWRLTYNNFNNVYGLYSTDFGEDQISTCKKSF